MLYWLILNNGHHSLLNNLKNNLLRTYMGTRATTRIQSKDDFIELYTRWDGFPGEIKSNLKSIFDIWKFTLQQFEKSISNKRYQSPYITKWLDNMNTLIYTAKTENDIVVIA